MKAPSFFVNSDPVVDCMSSCYTGVKEDRRHSYSLRLLEHSLCPCASVVIDIILESLCVMRFFNLGLTTHWASKPPLGVVFFNTCIMSCHTKYYTNA